MDRVSDVMRITVSAEAKFLAPARYDACRDSGRSKLPSKAADISHYQNPNIYTPEESSQ